MVRALLAYTTFEAGALPSLMRLRRPAAKEQPRSGGAASLVVADFVELECTSGRGSAQWCSLLDFVELCDPSLCWTVRFWFGYRVAEWRAEESEAEPWWRGESDTARCADAELPPSDGEHEDDRREASERAQDERACSQAECSQASDDLGEQSEEEPRVAVIAAMAAAAKARKRKGQSFECLASRRAGRYALRFHLVFKDGGAKKRSQFQITCDHHPPEVLLNKAGKQASRTNWHAAKHSVCMATSRRMRERKPLFENWSNGFAPGRVCTRDWNIRVCVTRTSAAARATQMMKSAALLPPSRAEGRRSAMGRVRPLALEVASLRALLARLRRVTLQLVHLRPLLRSRPRIGVGSAGVITMRQIASGTEFCS